MPSIRNTFCLATTIGLTLLTAVGAARAQTAQYRTSTSFVAIDYDDRSAASAFAHGFYRTGGATLNASGSTSYSFGEGSGTSLGANSDTMTLSGNGWARSQGYGFTDLKAGVSSTLSNAYLDLRNIENAPTNSDGATAPYHWIASASAGWTLTSRFNGFSVAGNNYTVKWLFGVDGVTNSHDAGYGTAYLNFGYDGNPSSYFNTSSLTPQVWATSSMPVRWGESVQTRADFYAQWQYNMLSDAAPVYEDGILIGHLADPTITATVDYASSVTLQEIQVFDQNGNRFYDFTVDDGAGNVFYSGNASVVPEPGTFLLAGGGLLALLPLHGLHRRAKKRDA